MVRVSTSNPANTSLTECKTVSRPSISQIPHYLQHESSAPPIQIPGLLVRQVVLGPVIRERISTWLRLRDFHSSIYVGSSTIPEIVDRLVYQFRIRSLENPLSGCSWFKFSPTDPRYSNTASLLSSFIVQLWPRTLDSDNTFGDILESRNLFPARTDLDLWHHFCHVSLASRERDQYLYIIGNLEQCDDGGKWASATFTGLGRFISPAF